MNKNMNIPKLRFEEFGGEWEEKKLGDILTFKNGINATKEQYGKGYKFINVLDIINNTTIKYENIIGSVDVSKEIFEKNKVVYGNILFQRSSETRIDAGQSNVYLDKNNSATFGGFVIRGQQKIDYNPEFMNYMFKTQLARKEISQKSNGSTHFNVGQETLSKVLVILPSKQEQEKIASFLTSVDTKIEQLTKKEALLQEYKKGVMNKIFNQEIRFKDDDGREFPEWEEKKLGDLINLIVDNRGKTPPSSSDEIIPLIEVNAIGQKNIDYSKISKFVSEDTFNSWFRKYLQKGDVLFSTVGQTAICSFYDDEKKVVIAQNIVGLRFDIDNSEFMYYMLIELNNHRKIKSIEMGAVQPSIKVSQLTELFFNIPCIQEQTKIANFLSSIDKKIDLITKELNSTKEFKKALLEQMFV